MQKLFDVMVIGGGIVGLTAALAMAERGYSTVVIDAGRLAIVDEKPDLRVFAINKTSERLLRSLHVWDLMDAARLSPYQHMHVWDAANGASIDFDARMAASSKLGTIIDEAVIRNALLKRAAQLETIVLCPDQAITQVDVGAELVSAASEQAQWQGRLLIIADGAHSPTRDKLNLPMTRWPYHQQALIATVKTEKPHEQTAFQVFNPEGPLAFLPLANEHQCGIVWSTNTAKQLLQLPEEDFNHRLTEAFARRLGSVSLSSERYQFPLTMRHTQQYSGKNWLVMGDAAHTIHPLAGLGLNIGLADVLAWMSCLDNASSLTSARALAAYQRQRKHAVWQSIALMEILKATFVNPLPPIKMLRGLGLRFCDQLTPLKRLFIAHAG